MADELLHALEIAGVKAVNVHAGAVAKKTIECGGLDDAAGGVRPAFGAELCTGAGIGTGLGANLHGIVMMPMTQNAQAEDGDAAKEGGLAEETPVARCGACGAYLGGSCFRAASRRSRAAVAACLRG